jgi:4'-phosphopantetheinyl transferase
MLTVAADEVHVSKIALNVDARKLETLLAVLSPVESERAARFHFDRDRRRFIVARASLRQVLSQYTGESPENLQFQYSRFGKPDLSPGSDVQFNVSHSGELALIAVTARRQVGIDIEQIRPIDCLLAIAERYFLPSELHELQNLAEAERLRAFFRHWTRKEAYIKAIGTGLSTPLDFVAPAQWSFANVPVDDGYTAVVAVEGPLKLRDA